MNKVTLQQITLITDGTSNYGISPVEAAGQALKNQITVNVIGITEQGKIGERGKSEIEQTALAGGGVSYIVPLEHIAKTVQMVTRQAMNKTIQQVIHRQLIEIIGNQDVTQLPPVKRVEVAHMADHLAEFSDLKILLLIDQSASMINKMKKVGEAILDFQLSLSSRSGGSLVSIATFPGTPHFIDVKIPWTNQINQIHHILGQIRPRGNTPTGPAIQACIEYFNSGNQNRNTGVLDEYVL